MTEPDITARFESLGDNCELGFIQRFVKNEEGGLLRWAVSSPRALIDAITHDFEGLYAYENLTPHTDGMILDAKYGLHFHSTMRSKDKVFVNSDEERRALYDIEVDKVQYLVKKLNALLVSGERIFVYKHNAGMSDDTLRELGAAIASKGPGKLLYVTDTGDENVGSVRHFEKNIFIGKIDSFASYAQANQPSVEGWRSILETYLSDIEMTAQE